MRVSLELEAREVNKIDEIIYKETQKAAYEEHCEQGFVHQEQPNEDYFECLNDYLDGTKDGCNLRKTCKGCCSPIGICNKPWII